MNGFCDTCSLYSLTYAFYGNGVTAENERSVVASLVDLKVNCNWNTYNAK